MSLGKEGLTKRLAKRKMPRTMTGLLTWKHEDFDEEGFPVGPIFFSRDAELGPFPGDEEVGEQYGWVRRAFARDLAQEKGWLYGEDAPEDLPERI
jgi:hypothetical protein